MNALPCTESTFLVNTEISNMRMTIVLLCDVFHIGLVIGPRPAVLARGARPAVLA